MAYNALKEAFYSQYSSQLLLVDYDLLAQKPDKILHLIYQVLEEEPFNHDFENVQYDAPEFDKRLNTKGLHTVRSKVELRSRQMMFSFISLGSANISSLQTDETQLHSPAIKFHRPEIALLKSSQSLIPK